MRIKFLSKIQIKAPTVISIINGPSGPAPVDNLLLENGDDLLLEDGSLILLETA